MAVLTEALSMAPFGAVADVDAKLRAWRALANLAMVDQFDQASDTENEWDALQVAYYTNAMDDGFDLNITNDPSVLTYEYAKLFGNLPLYASYWWDARLGLYHVRHRVYDPVAGRWLQRDPIGYAGGNNLYGYVGNGPFTHYDPFGLDAWAIGEVARYFGFVGLGEFADNAVDGLLELVDPESGVVAAAAKGLLKGAVTGIVVAVVATAIAATGPVAAAAVTALLVASAVYTAWYAYNNWGSMTDKQKWGFVGEALGSVIAGGITSRLTMAFLRSVITYNRPETGAVRAMLSPKKGASGTCNGVNGHRGPNCNGGWKVPFRGKAGSHHASLSHEPIGVWQFFSKYPLASQSRLYRFANSPSRIKGVVCQGCNSSYGEGPPLSNIVQYAPPIVRPREGCP
jgi:RHS repeat-associated protein